MPCVISSTKTPFKFYDITFTANSYVYRQVRNSKHTSKKFIDNAIFLDKTDCWFVMCIC